MIFKCNIIIFEREERVTNKMLEVLIRVLAGLTALIKAG